MLKAADLFHISYYKKTHFTGSMKGMRYYIEKAEENETPVFRAWIFPGPFCFDKTEEKQKECRIFPFEEESLALIAEWLNAQYEARAEYWNQHQYPLAKLP